MPAGRPASIRTRRFLRILSDEQAAILAHAGDGDISAGFRNVIDFYWQSVNANLFDSSVSNNQPLNNAEQDAG